jgi:hypothetical protein
MSSVTPLKVIDRGAEDEAYMQTNAMIILDYSIPTLKREGCRVHGNFYDLDSKPRIDSLESGFEILKRALSQSYT